MFLGEYQHTLDAKGRVSLPAKFRAQTTTKVIVSKGLDECLWVFPSDSFSSFLERIEREDEFKGKARKLRRHFMAGSVEIELDSAGRISLPPVLREYASLEKDVAITGNGDRIEIWDANAWVAYSTETAESIEDFAEELASASLP